MLITTVKNGSKTQALLLDCVQLKLAEREENLNVLQIQSGFRATDILCMMLPVIKAILYIFIKREKILHIHYRGFLIGKYAASAAYRRPESYVSSRLFLYNFFHALGRCVKLINQCIKYRNEVKGFFPTEITYTNGVFIEIAFKWRKRLFIQHYPNNIREIDTEDKQNKIDLFLVKKTNILNKAEKGQEIILKLLQDPNSRADMKDINFTELNGNIDQPYAIIYAHSFTDAQQDIGGEENYVTMLDWLEHTLFLLKDKRVMVKAHPAFYANNPGENISTWDQMVFKRFKQNYRNPKHSFIDYPMTNKSLLDQLSKDVLLISHHGNSLLEGGYLGFRCLSASAAFWRGRNIFTEWTNRDDYKHLLLQPDKIQIPQKRDIVEYLADLYLSKTSCFYDESWQNILASELGVSFSDVFSGGLDSFELTQEVKQRCIRRIMQSF